MSEVGTRDWRRALRSYVLGHDRGFDPSTKTALAAEEIEAEAVPSRRAAHPPERAGNASASEVTGAAPGDGTAPEAAAVDIPQVGVPVPDELDFHRGPSTWRDRIPGLRRGGR